MLAALLSLLRSATLLAAPGGRAVFAVSGVPHPQPASLMPTELTEHTSHLTTTSAWCLCRSAEHCGRAVFIPRQ
jgi:hypothetical protein